MELFPFQLDASSQIARRFHEYAVDPLLVTRSETVPFYQNLSAITGSGKTVILADAIEQIRTLLPIEPVVLWVSKGKVVVWQTYTNLSTGKYADLLGGYDVKPLLDCKPSDVADSDRGLILVATVAKFNQRDKSEGDRKIFRTGLDSADSSLWQLLKERKDGNGLRRPLLVVYDEGHNLSDQQTELLQELSPDALVAASATIKVPEALSNIIARLRIDKKWRDEDFVTSVRSAEVVDAGLVKKQILLGGYMTPMESAVDELIKEMGRAEEAAVAHQLPFRPKAIYVSSTNTVDGTSIIEDVGRPFKERMARPILIWRYLVEKKGVDPRTIAVYCNLKFDRKTPPPPNFKLFSGGDADYDQFVSGNFRHVIFNLSLQEGWDDPWCCFAYIDKEMGSADQVTQVVGRVLRQPGTRHYPSEVLNTAHFYIRADEKGVFESVLQDVRAKITAELPDITITVRNTSSGYKSSEMPAQKVKTVPAVSVYSARAMAPIRRIVEQLHDYRGDTTNTIGKGGRIQVLQTIGSGDDAREEWVDVEHSNPVTARWVLRRTIHGLMPDRHNSPVNLCDIEDPKFDAFIEYNSKAADAIRKTAAEIVEAYLENSEIIQLAQDQPYTVGSVFVDQSDFTPFANAIHKGYSKLNPFELKFAKAIDSTRRVWCRNPSQSGYRIPLLGGKTSWFYPDFLVWTDNDRRIVAIETKGDHLLVEDAARKLFDIKNVDDGPEVVIRFVSEGEWREGSPVSRIAGTGGMTVWSLRNGRLHGAHYPSESEAVRACLS